MLWESAVHICVYGMEGPGGYQFVGRTTQMWSRYRKMPTSSKASHGYYASLTRSSSMKCLKKN